MADKKKKRNLKSMPFGSNAMRMNWLELLLVAAVSIAIFGWGLPWLYGRWERFDFSTPDFRLGYDLRDDYWSYRKWCEYASEHFNTVFVGDSVIWGMYTDTPHTLSAHYNKLKGSPVAANLGIDGLHPLALEGLMRDFGSPLRGKKVYLYFNPLWLNDVKFDLSGLPLKNKDGEPDVTSIMHPRLIPQFDYTNFYYTDPLKKRVSNTLEREVPLFSLLNHLRSVWYGNLPLPEWTMQNPARLPWSPIRRRVEAVETEHLNRSEPWNSICDFEVAYSWVQPRNSRQWQAFTATAQLLKERGNEVVVLLGAFNTYLLDEASLEAYEELAEAVADDLDDLNIEYIQIDLLPSETYADASYPLSDGYQLMAEQIIEYEEQQK